MVVLAVEYGVLRHHFNEYELLEEPRRMREMPLCRADARHGLNDEVPGLQCPAVVERGAPNPEVALRQWRYRP